MSQNSEIPEALLCELGSLVNEMEDEIAKNKLVVGATEKALGEIVRKYYPRMSEWHAADLRRLSDRISRVAQNFCVEVADMDYRAQKDNA